MTFITIQKNKIAESLTCAKTQLVCRYCEVYLSFRLKNQQKLVVDFILSLLFKYEW